MLGSEAKSAVAVGLLEGAQGVCNLAAMRVTAFGWTVTLGIAACTSAPSDDPRGGDSAAVHGLYIAPSLATGDQFFDHPWPSDARLEEGKVPLVAFPVPRTSSLLTSYLTTMDRKLDGFSPVAAGYVRFDGDIDPASLPAGPEATLDAESVLQLINIDRDSAHFGERLPVSHRYHPADGVYVHARMLAWMPALGFPMNEGTRYALVVTKDLRAAGGGELGPSSELKNELAGALADVASALNDAGVEASRIGHLAVVTTGSPTAELFAIANHLDEAASPAVLPGSWNTASSGSYGWEVQGEYGPSPNYQHGEIPFTVEGGGFAFEGDTPQVASTFNLRFSLTVPLEAKCAMPKDGYPLVMVAHGTGGDFRSYVDDGTAKRLASRCAAVMGVDQIFHGTRPGANPDDPSAAALSFFNFQNIVAARTNMRQSAIDELQRARLVRSGGLTVPAGVSPTGKAVTFDARKIAFFGHSQGGLNGTLFLATDAGALGGVLSGTSSVLSVTLVEKKLPLPDISALIRQLALKLTEDEAGELDVMHPAISLAQMLVDTVDPIHYARYILRAPKEGATPKSIYMTEGVAKDGSGDAYAPVHGTEALAVALGLPLLSPSVFLLDQLSYGMASTEVPASGLAGNLSDGTATGALAQFEPDDPAEDGHFVVFKAPAAAQSSDFLESLFTAAPGVILPAAP